MMEPRFLVYPRDYGVAIYLADADGFPTTRVGGFEIDFEDIESIERLLDELERDLEK